MNKADLTQAIAGETGLSQRDADLWLKSFINVVSKTLKKKQRVQLVGFGSFEVRKRNARTGVNPQTGEKIKIKARHVPRFSAGKALKDLIA
jgi:DNA-binding protein HU-beta